MSEGYERFMAEATAEQATYAKQSAQAARSAARATWACAILACASLVVSLIALLNAIRH